jgi:hypothetical protein
MNLKNPFRIKTGKNLKGKLFLMLKNRTIKTYVVMEVMLHTFLNSTLSRGVVSFTLRSVYRGERAVVRIG